ncbi:DUF1330 domain-containing protein [Algicella marina]|uniref:DUF1330 domain-containing protein n=1 Tax=Algicella marina TaxID=2683284 RepID=A0A6P1SZ28_9RHOB|nr:DUF1330 domain-containing protein [Algicella marina]QHQ34870.1 DUF1330 domain-containing protein [Algicella marina]
MAAYSIVHADVHDADAYAKYAELAGPAVARFGGVFLARGGKSVQKEGQGRSRNVIIQWPDMATAEEFYASSDYAAALALGLPASEREYTIVEGL